MDTSNYDRGTADITDRPISNIQSITNDAPSPMKFYDSQHQDNTPTAISLTPGGIADVNIKINEGKQ